MGNPPADQAAAYQCARQRAAELIQRVPTEGEYWLAAARQLLAAILYVLARDDATPVAAVHPRALLERLSDGQVTALLVGETAPPLSADRDWYLDAAPQTRATVLAVAHAGLESHLHKRDPDDRPLLGCSLVEYGLVVRDEPCDDRLFDSVYLTLVRSSQEIYGCPVHAARVLAQHPTARVRTFTADARDALRRLLPEHPLAAPDE